MDELGQTATCAVEEDAARRIMGIEALDVISRVVSSLVPSLVRVSGVRARPAGRRKIAERGGERGPSGSTADAEKET